MGIDNVIRELLALPSSQQVAAARAFLHVDPGEMPEEWNTTFGPKSLFDAWCRTSVARSVHGAVRDAVAPAMRDDFVFIDVGGGDGSTWRGLFSKEQRGTIYVVDPVKEAVDRVRTSVPAGVNVRAIVAPVQAATLPDADVVVCSLTLHHVAGRDADQRAKVGMEGVGKLEVLTQFRRSLTVRRGFGILVEADVDCDLDLAPGDPQLADNIFDSYVRRCARSILEDIESSTADESLRARWRGLLRHWFLGQLVVADVAIEQRDVYELSVSRWLELLSEAGLTVSSHNYTDELPLFHRYTFRP